MSAISEIAKEIEKDIAPVGVVRPLEESKGDEQTTETIKETADADASEHIDEDTLSESEV